MAYSTLPLLRSTYGLKNTKKDICPSVNALISTTGECGLNVDWSCAFDTDNLESVWSNFTDIIFKSVDKFAVKVEPGPARPSKTYPNAVNKLLSKKRQYGKLLELSKPMH